MIYFIENASNFLVALDAEASNWFAALMEIDGKWIIRFYDIEVDLDGEHLDQISAKLRELNSGRISDPNLS